MATCPPYGTASAPPAPTPERVLRTTRGIAVATILGPVILAAVATWIGRRSQALDAEVLKAIPGFRKGAPFDSPFAGWALAGLALVLLVVSWVVRGRLAEGAVRANVQRRGMDPAAARLLAFQTSTVGAIALNEAAALLAGVAVLLTHDPVPFAPAFGIALAGMLLHFPSAAKLEAFLADPRDTVSP